MFSFIPQLHQPSFFSPSPHTLPINSLLNTRLHCKLSYLLTSKPLFSLKKSTTLFKPINKVAALSLSIYIMARINKTYKQLKTKENTILLRKTMSSFSLSKNDSWLNSLSYNTPSVKVSKHVARLFLLSGLLFIFYANESKSVRISSTTPLCNVAHSMSNFIKNLCLSNLYFRWVTLF